MHHRIFLNSLNHYAIEIVNEALDVGSIACPSSARIELRQLIRWRSLCHEVPCIVSYNSLGNLDVSFALTRATNVIQPNEISLLSVRMDVPFWVWHRISSPPHASQHSLFLALGLFRGS